MIRWIAGGLVLIAIMVSPAYGSLESIEDWRVAMCDYTEKLVADTAEPDPGCLSVGACARLDEQPERMCEPDGGRADQIATACLAGNSSAVHTYVNATASSWFHHVGLAADYLRDGRITATLFFEDMGDPATPDPRMFPSLTAAKIALREHARAVGIAQTSVLPNAMSGYGEVLRWQAGDPCTD